MGLDRLGVGLLDDGGQPGSPQCCGGAGAVEALGHVDEHGPEALEVGKGPSVRVGSYAGEPSGPIEATAGDAGDCPGRVTGHAFTLESGSHDVVGQRTQVDALTPRDHRGQQIVGRRSHQHEMGGGRRFLEGLEQLVLSRLVHSVGLEHDDDLASRFVGRADGRLDDVGSLLLEDRRALGLDLDAVGMAAPHGARADMTRAATTLGAQQHAAARQRAASSRPDPGGPARR